MNISTSSRIILVTNRVVGLFLMLTEEVVRSLGSTWWQMRQATGCCYVDTSEHLSRARTWHCWIQPSCTSLHAAVFMAKQGPGPFHQVSPAPPHLSLFTQQALANRRAVSTAHHGLVHYTAHHDLFFEHQSATWEVLLYLGTCSSSTLRHTSNHQWPSATCRVVTNIFPARLACLVFTL